MPKRHTVALRVPPELKARFDAVAFLEKKSLNEAGTEALEEYLAAHYSGQALELAAALRGKVPA